MAKRGRKPVPESIRILKGSRATSGSVPVVPGRPERPDHLDETARVEWDRMVKLLDQMGVLSQGDGAALALYCVAYSRWIEARKAIADDGLVFNTDLGGVKPNPAVTIAAAAEVQMARLLANFGCTPHSRSKVKGRGEQAKDALGEFLDKKRKT